MGKGLAVIKEHADANRYCAPAALSIVSGESVESVTQVLREVTGQRAIKGVWSHHLTQALYRMGIRHNKEWHGCENPTLARWLRTFRKPEATYIVRITGHYLVVRGRKIADNRFTEGTWLRQYPRRRARVKESWLIF